MRAAMPQETIGKRIKRVRMQRGLTQGELGTLMGVRQSQVSRWERDQGEMWPSTRRELAKALGVTQEWLAGSPEEDLQPEAPRQAPMGPLQALRKSIHALAHAAATQHQALDLEEALDLLQALARETLELQRAPTTQDALDVLHRRAQSRPPGPGRA